MALFAIMMCVNFTACSSDDDEENFESSLIGTWLTVKKNRDAIHSILTIL